MKTILTTALLAALILPAVADAGTLVRRDARQEARIATGWVQGDLTRCEATRLSARDRAIDARTRVYRATGPGIGPVERRDLHGRRDSLSRDIAEQRRDGRGCW
jgi:hypothetical protein